jgi:integrase
MFLMHNVAEDFREVLFALRHTGTRPGNVCKVTADNFLDEPGVWVFEEQNTQEGNTVHKTYETTHEPLIVPLTPELVDLCKRLRARHPEGPLFRKADSEPWTPQAISDRFYRYRNRFREMGVPIPEVCFAYCYRHQTATALIAGGETDAMAAAVIGHKGTRTFHKHYNHVLARAPELVNALRRQVRALPGEAAALHGDGGDPEPPAEG